MTRKNLFRAALLLIVVAVLLYFQGRPEPNESGSTTPSSAAPVSGSRPVHAGDRAILDAFAERRSGMMVESVGTVEKILSDDLQGSRHQRFILRLDVDHTLLVSHNIDVAQRVPLDERDRVAFRGQYEWNERGGVIHWTHHDPDGRHPGGWIRHRGSSYE